MFDESQIKQSLKKRAVESTIETFYPVPDYPEYLASNHGTIKRVEKTIKKARRGEVTLPEKVLTRISWGLPRVTIGGVGPVSVAKLVYSAAYQVPLNSITKMYFKDQDPFNVNIWNLTTTTLKGKIKLRAKNRVLRGTWDGKVYRFTSIAHASEFLGIAKSTVQKYLLTENSGWSWVLPTRKKLESPESEGAVLNEPEPIWLPCKYEPLQQVEGLEVSNMGEVRIKGSEGGYRKIPSNVSGPRKYGRKSISVGYYATIDGKPTRIRKTAYLHILVACTHIPEYYKGCNIIFLDDNTWNCSAENLLCI
jgi:hypothetical protein